MGPTCSARDRDALVILSETTIDSSDFELDHSQLGAYFDIEGRNTYLTAELRAGVVAFLTVSTAAFFMYA